KSCPASSNKNSQAKKLLMFLTWLDLLPQMQAFEHCLPRGRTEAV
ncbi:hypothetical protein HMPREF1362_02131, partial [Enterococcus faecium ERV102]